MSFLAAIASAVLGGVLNKKADDRAQENEVENTIEQLPRLRESAEAAGFNPLSVLQANGSASFKASNTGAAPLASAQALTGLIETVFDRNGKKAVEKSHKKAKLKLDRIAEEGKASTGVRHTINKTSAVAVSSKKLPVFGVPSSETTDSDLSLHRPRMAGGVFMKGAIPVIGLTGKRELMDATVARRLDMEPFDQKMVADNEDIFGDAGGELVSTPSLPVMIQTQGGGLSGQNTIDERNSIVGDPYHINNILPWGTGKKDPPPIRGPIPEEKKRGRNNKRTKRPERVNPRSRPQHKKGVRYDPTPVITKGKPQ
jgi:hypothetical protein